MALSSMARGAEVRLTCCCLGESVQWFSGVGIVDTGTRGARPEA